MFKHTENVDENSGSTWESQKFKVSFNDIVVKKLETICSTSTMDVSLHDS